MLPSHIYHLVRFSNFLGPFVSYIRNHLIESLKSIFLYFQLAFCCPFWLSAYSDSLVSGISTSVFCGSDYVSKNSYCYPWDTEEKKKKSLALPSSAASLSSPCISAQLQSIWNADILYQDCSGWAVFLLKFPIKVSKNTGYQEICSNQSEYMGKHTQYVASACPHSFLCSFVKQYSLTAIFIPGNKCLSQSGHAHRFHFISRIDLLAISHCSIF